MDPERWQQIDQLFHSALKCEPAARATFLQACIEDEALRHEVASLVESHEQSNSFIEEPATDLAAELLAGEVEALAAGQVVGPYKIVSLLGQGGMGEVYLAQDQRLGRQVALKLLPAQFTRDADRVRRFEQEARAVSALNHPNIVTIHEIGNSNSRHFITTEFIDGETLRQHMVSNRLNLDAVLDIATQIASALAAAHAARIVHRDIKPDNIMIRPDGYVKVLDFGLAKLIEQDHQTLLGLEDPTAQQNPTAKGVILGTVNYMSPEQAKGGNIDGRSDIFSLGVVLYEMITGRKPFAGDSLAETFANLVNLEPPPLSRFVSNPPDDLRRIVSKTLRKNKDERYQLMKDLLIDLKTLKENLTLEKRSESVHDRDSASTRSPATIGSGAQTIESKNGVFQKILHHRLSAALVLIILLTTIGLGVWRFSRFSARKQIESIAVLPFVNESGNSDVEYLSDGMTETLINSLAQLPNLAVKARSSVFHYKGKETDAKTIGKELNVQAVLNGRVVQRGQDLTLYLELVDTQTGNRIWGDQYNRKQSELISLQSEIARKVSERLKTELSSADEQKLAKNHTANPEAYQLYLKGLFYLNKRTTADVQKAVEYFQHSVAVDPDYALGYAELANACLMYRGYRIEQRSEVTLKAKDAVLKALSLDPRLGEAHAALGLILFGEDLAGAEREYQRAIELNPNYATTYLYYHFVFIARRDWEAALAMQRRGLEIEPFSLIINREYGTTFFWARRYDEAIVQLNKTVELDPSFPSAHYILAITYQMKGDYAKSVEEHSKYQELNGEPQKAALLRESFSKGGWQGFLRTITDERHQIDLSWDDLTAYYAALGDKQRAFALLNKRVDEGLNPRQASFDPRLDSLRDDPRFDEMLKRSGLK
jgi:eukaryotic-like serine/threonine-protein kinase